MHTDRQAHKHANHTSMQTNKDTEQPTYTRDTNMHISKIYTIHMNTKINKHTPHVCLHTKYTKQDTI